MKTKALKYVKFLLVGMLTVGFAACEAEVDVFYDDDGIGNAYYRRSAELCSRTWVSEYRDIDGNRCRQEIDFYLDRTGVDYILVRYPGGGYDEYEHHFRWSWENYAQTSIRMNYGGGDISFFDDIYLGGNILSGYLDGPNNYVEFRGRY